MSEWLTTGQMIDRLKVGEVAIPDDEKYLAVKRTKDGFIWVDRDTHEQSKIHQDYFKIHCYTIRLKWRILPRYVSFEEAMKALMNGKTVWLWQGDEKVGYYIDKESGKLWAIAGDCTAPVEKIYFGEKWTIEE
jgi:hypothetical protein